MPISNQNWLITIQLADGLLFIGKMARANETDQVEQPTNLCVKHVRAAHVYNIAYLLVNSDTSRMNFRSIGSMRTNYDLPFQINSLTQNMETIKISVRHNDYLGCLIFLVFSSQSKISAKEKVHKMDTIEKVNLKTTKRPYFEN